MKNNVVGWFEIPVKKMERAIGFYEEILNVKLTSIKMGNFDMALFPMLDDKPGSSGALVYNSEFYKPSTDGVLLYFTAHSGDLANELSKVEAAGGQIIQPKTEIPDNHGYMALFFDTEGNRVALHSNK